MARTDWVAINTEPAAEYVAASELARFSLPVYLPQARRSFSLVAGKIRLRLYPLFPRYLLLPLRHCDRELIRQCRGVYKLAPVLADREGVVWRAPDSAIQAIRDAEARGDFVEENFRKGDAVRLNSPNLQEIHGVIEKNDKQLLTVFTPLLGGARVRVSRAKVHGTALPR